MASGLSTPLLRRGRLDTLPRRDLACIDSLLVTPCRWHNTSSHRLAVRSAAAQRNGFSRRRTGLGSEAILAAVPGWSQTSDTAGAQRIGHTCRHTARDGACACQPVAALREGLHLIDARCSAVYWSRLCRQVHVISPVNDALRDHTRPIGVSIDRYLERRRLHNRRSARRHRHSICLGHNNRIGLPDCFHCSPAE